MIFDYYASLAKQQACPNRVNESGLASGFVDGCTVWSCNSKEKNEARCCYMKSASDLKDLKLPPDLSLEPDFSQLPDPSWFGIKFEFELLLPWYSKDDRLFHVLDNPVRKDRVFGVPFMSAASWKGLLRWAYGMETGLVGPFPESDPEKRKEVLNQLIHLFGNEKGEETNFQRGSLVFYPTWFSKVGFEVINPHERKTKAGTKPIYYEVVPAGMKGSLRLLYAPLPIQIENDKVKPTDFIGSLIDSIAALLKTYGISAKRTSGWGAVEVKSGVMYLVEGSWWLERIDGSDDNKQYVPPSDDFLKLMKNNGDPIGVLLNKDNTFLSKTGWRKLRDKKPCNKKVFEEFKEWYESHSGEYRGRMKGDEERGQSPKVREFPFKTLSELKTEVKKLEIARKGGGQ